MNQDERAALERLLEYVGRGFCAVQSDCKMLREFLASLPALPPVPTTTAEFISQANQLGSLMAVHIGSLKELPLDKDAVINDLRQRLIASEQAKAIRAEKRARAKNRAQKATKAAANPRKQPPKRKS